MDRSTDTSIQSSPVVNPSIKGGNNENELKPEMAHKLKSPNKKQLPTKNFMSPTISAAIKAANPKRRILAERNETEIETLDVVEQQPSLVRPTSFGSKAAKLHVVDGTNDDDYVKKDLVSKPCLEPYDPTKNYLSPRPKFLRYNPNRRRNILDLQENDMDSVKSSVSPSSGLYLGLGSSGSMDSCSEEESVKEVEDLINEKCEGEDDENDEVDGEEDDFEGDDESRGWNFTGFLKFLAVMIALMLTTQAICLMNSPKDTLTLESVLSCKGWYTNAYGAASSNFSEIVHDPMTEVDSVVGSLKEEEVCDDYKGLDMLETIEELAEMQDEEQIDEVENDETDLVHGEIWRNQEDVDKLQLTEVLQEQEIAASVKVETNNFEAVTEVPDFKDGALIEENSKLTADAEFEIANDMEKVLEEISDIAPTDLSNKLATFDPTLAIIIGLAMLIVTSLGLISRSKQTKFSSPVPTTVVQENNVAKKEVKILEPTSNQQSLIQQIDEPLVDSASLQKDVSEETNHIHAPSVELLGEFVFGEEVTSNVSAEANASNSLMQATTYSFSQSKSTYMEMSTGDSHTVKKQRRKSTEVSSMVTPSPVRRSSRLQNRSIMSP